MQFQYTALNNENKKLSGFINAPTEDNARNQLNDLGLAVLSILTVEGKDTGEKSGEKLKFEALDKNGKKIIGTIPETDKGKAFKRLREEYGFQVLALYAMNAGEEEKAMAKTDIENIKSNYELIAAEEEVPDILTDKEKGVRSKLLEEVGFVIDKINEIFKKFGDNMRPEEKKRIEQIEDKLLRLKNSNNLNFIKQTSEELLKAVQSKEIYLEQDRFVQERERVKLETQKLLLEIHKLNTSPNVGIFNEDIDISHGKLSFIGKFRKKESQEVQEIKNEIKNLNGQIFDYLRIWIKAAKKLKPEIKSKMSELGFQKKELKAKLKSMLKEEKLKRGHDSHGKMDDDLILVTSWLLAFYLTYYFISYYLSFKSTFLNSRLDFETNIYLSPILTYLILTVFLLHVALQTKKFFMKDSGIYNYVSYPLIIIAVLLVNINF